MDLPRRLRTKQRPSGHQLVPQLERVRHAEEETEEGGITQIVSDGDVVLEFEHERSTTMKTTNRGQVTLMASFRVHCATLRSASPYFHRLLDPDGFQEGVRVAEIHKKLLASHASIGDVDVSSLPKVKIKNVGSIGSVKSIQMLMADFLSILHDRDISNPAPPLANIANISIVADRFDALPIVSRYLKSRKLMRLLDGKTPDRSNKSMPEEKARQRLLVGLLLDNPAWVGHSSIRLIQRGWLGHEESDGDSALWWNLPAGIEEELLFRRDCILETIQSIQAHFLAQYTTRERQCRLGYDSSAECDIYQLGQMIRFFKKIGTLDLAGTIIPSPSDDDNATIAEPYSGDLIDLIDSLRQCPEYQINEYHKHCGLRTRLMPLLDMLEFSLTEVGICMPCWTECRHEYAWTRVKRPLVWKKDSAGAGMVEAYRNRQAQRHLVKHLDTRDMFMARERIWSNRLETARTC